MIIYIFFMIIFIILLLYLFGYIIYDVHDHRLRLEAETVNLAWRIHDIRTSQMPNAKESRSVILVEGRCHHLLKLTLQNARERLPHWKIHVVHCKENEDFVHKIVNEIGGEVQLTMLKLSNLKINQFSRLIASPYFWEHIVNTDRVLITQTDAWLCHDSTHRIEDYFVYDYVGAPWVQWRGSEPSTKENAMVGNCGLCLCKRTVLLETTQQYPYSDFVKETSSHAVDVYFGRYIVNTAPAIIAKSFSVENVWYDRPLGVHKPYNMSKYRLLKLEKHCDGVMNLSKYY